MNPLKQFPTLNNAWMDLKHRVNHWRKRQSREFRDDITLNDPRNVLIVVVDCLRADHVGGFGYDR